jgi:hypothetical protein
MKMSELKAALKSWQALNKALPSMNEGALIMLMKLEQRQKKRLMFLLRIYGRFSVVRTERERNELTQ